mgnify:CR=1 FL=1|jgi:uncharacterized membrane protein YgdD (TMEM256/DUF423 family)
MRLTNPWLIVASLSSFLAIVAGAYGAHSLSDNKIFKDAFDTAFDFHMWYSLSLLSIAVFYEIRLKTDHNKSQTKWIHLSGILFVMGMILFCGSLYALGLNIVPPIAGLAPTGGITLMAGWITLAFSATR